MPAEERTPGHALIVQSINDVIDLDAERLGALENRIPLTIWILIGFMAILTGVAMGYSMKAIVRRKVLTSFGNETLP